MPAAKSLFDELDTRYELDTYVKFVTLKNEREQQKKWQTLQIFRRKKRKYSNRFGASFDKMI